jgi:hypothetical protein
MIIIQFACGIYSLLRDLLVGILNTRSFPSVQAAYMVDTWQKVAVSENELPKKYLQSYDLLMKN